MAIRTATAQKAIYAVYKNRVKEYQRKGKSKSLAVALTSIDYNVSTATVWNALRNRPVKKRTQKV